MCFYFFGFDLNVGFGCISIDCISSSSLPFFLLHTVQMLRLVSLSGVRIYRPIIYGLCGSYNLRKYQGLNLRNEVSTLGLASLFIGLDPAYPNNIFD